MKNLRLLILAIITTLTALSYVSPVSADTVTTRDGREIKGIVVEDYKDRLIISTIDGEMTLMKANIFELYFDSEEDNLIKLADQAKERRDFAKAYAYYDLANKKNPNSKAATDGLVFCQGYLFRKDEERKLNDIMRREEYERYGSVVVGEKSEDDKMRDSAERLERTIGISLRMEGGTPVIERIRSGSPAYTAEMRRNDRLVAIWSRLTGYMPLPETINTLLDKPSLEVKCTIERTVDVARSRRAGLLSGTKDIIGATFSMELDGLTVAGIVGSGSASQSGIKKDDLVTAINGQSTRYMPLKKAIDLIKKTQKPSIELTIRRNLTIWRNDAK